MATVGQGGTYLSEARFRDGTGVLVDPVGPLVDILDPADAVVVNDAVPTRVSLGVYTYSYVVSPTATLGAWRARWSGTINGVPISGDDTFTVVAAGSVTPTPGGGYLWVGTWPVYATMADYEAFMGEDVPTTEETDVERMLARATQLLDSLPLSFDVDAGNVPSVTAERVALRDAACAIVESWRNGGGDAVVLSGSGMSLSELSLDAATAGTRPAVPSRAMQILTAAGLLPATVATW